MTIFGCLLMQFGVVVFYCPLLNSVTVLNVCLWGGGGGGGGEMCMLCVWGGGGEDGIIDFLAHF